MNHRILKHTTINSVPLLLTDATGYTDLLSYQTTIYLKQILTTSTTQIHIMTVNSDYRRYADLQTDDQNETTLLKSKLSNETDEQTKSTTTLVTSKSTNSKSIKSVC